MLFSNFSKVISIPTNQDTSKSTIDTKDKPPSYWNFTFDFFGGCTVKDGPMPGSISTST